jgi:hypothetical protein
MSVTTDQATERVYSPKEIATTTLSMFNIRKVGGINMSIFQKLILSLLGKKTCSPEGWICRTIQYSQSSITSNNNSS